MGIYSLNVNLMLRDYIEKHPNKCDKVCYTKYLKILGSKDIRDFFTKQLNEKCEECLIKNNQNKFRIIKDPEACQTCILKQNDIATKAEYIKVKEKCNETTERPSTSTTEILPTQFGNPKLHHSTYRLDAEEKLKIETK